MSILRTRVTNLNTGARVLVTMTREIDIDPDSLKRWDRINVENDNVFSSYSQVVLPTTEITPHEDMAVGQFFSPVFAYALDDVISGGEFLMHPFDPEAVRENTEF